MCKKWLTILLAAMMLACAPCALAAEITVQGSGVINADPDMVTITANAEATAGTMLAAQEQVSAIIAAATEKLLALGVLDADIVTTSYGYNPSYSYEGDAPRLIGYQASHTISITCRDIQMLDSVIGAVTDSGLSQIYNVSYDVSSRGELYRQALDLAIRAAQEKAQAMAASSGMELTGLASLSENGGYDARYAVSLSAAKAEDAGLGTGIRAGGVSVSASVTAVYQAE